MFVQSSSHITTANFNAAPMVLRACCRYWAEVWPSALAASGLILDMPDITKHLRVAEIGCGLGLASFAAALAGAGSSAALLYSWLFRFVFTYA